MRGSVGTWGAWSSWYVGGWVGACVRACARILCTRTHASTYVAIEGKEANICADVKNVSASRRERDSWSIRAQD